jgi:hypothetical protein
MSDWVLLLTILVMISILGWWWLELLLAKRYLPTLDDDRAADLLRRFKKLSPEDKAEIIELTRQKDALKKK